MAGLGVPELLIILSIVVVLFGASRLAGVGNALGTTVREFRRSVRDEPSTAAIPIRHAEEPRGITRS